jgi:2-amino-4-hydroxy-6-hydroxymethyldihydropteridine diphosphokinase
MATDTLAIISLGSNLGDSAGNVSRALDRLESLSAKPLKRSSLWISSPLECPPNSPDFINAVALLTPRAYETAADLLAALKAVEAAFGRTLKKVLNESRILDLDLICFGEETRTSPELTLPHPRAHLRAFVLQPLAELLPNYVLPGQTKTVTELLELLPEQGRLTKLSK